MLTEEILRWILMGSGAILLIVLAVAGFELIRTLRWVRYTAEDLQPTIKEATEVLESLEPTIKNANNVLEALEPAIKRVDPLMERVSLTIDAVNLEIMRADQILANLTDVTDVASTAAKKVSNITDAPLNLLTSATDKVRTIFIEKRPERDSQEALNEAGRASAISEPVILPAAQPAAQPADQPAADQPASKPAATGPAHARTADEAVPASAAAPAPAPAPAQDSASTGVLQTKASEVQPVVQPTIVAASQDPDDIDIFTATEMIPPYQDEIEVDDPAGENRPQWPF